MSKLVEEWRDIQGFEGVYLVSDWGNVRSVDRTRTIYCKLTNTTIERVFKGCIKNKHLDAYGYEMVNLKNYGKHYIRKVHRLVAEAFIPNPENKPCVDHINGVRTDNRAENLRWCTIKENLNFPLARKNISEAQKNRKRVNKMESISPMPS